MQHVNSPIIINVAQSNHIIINQETEFIVKKIEVEDNFTGEL